MGVTYLPLKLAKVFYFVLEAILPTSHYMFFLDVTPEESLRRVSTREETEMFENLEDLKKVRFKALKFTKGWYVVNSCGTIENVQKQIDIILDDLDQINK